LAKDPEICFQFLVNTLGFTIHLGMIGGREGNIIGKELTKFFGKSKGKLGATVRDHFVMGTKTGKDVFEKEGSNAGSIDGFVARDENHPLCKPMVDHNQNRIKIGGD